ncbi:hypothetical protein [Kitasatospora sp. GP82]|uniref:hypothetical protein n=1 Tax=Kitasatospora sp. GP82 TaxID=3035089 RepID=UPI0024753DFC|nr:hypothetical protein [Kitasatospora sp. GP82]
MPNPPALRPAAPRPAARSWTGDVEAESLDALVSSSRRLGRFWPPLGIAPQSADAARPSGVSVPARAQLLVADMAEYGS